MALFGRQRKSPESNPSSNPAVGAVSEHVRRAGVLITYFVNQQVLAEIAEQLQVLIESCPLRVSSEKVQDRQSPRQAGYGPLAFTGELTRTRGSAVERSFASLPVTVQLRAVIERLIQLEAVGDFILNEHFIDVIALDSPNSDKQVADSMLRTSVKSSAEWAVKQRSWFLLEATWEIDKVDGLVRLIRPVMDYFAFARFAPHPDVTVVVNAPQAWSPQGELAILSAPTVSASVFGTASEWDDANITLA